MTKTPGNGLGYAMSNEEIRMILKQRKDLYAFIQSIAYLGYNSPITDKAAVLDNIMKRANYLIESLTNESGSIDLTGRATK